MNLTRLYATALTVLVAPPRRRDERGDVPGWVLVTLMSVVLIGAITAVAEPQLKSMVRNALNSVR
ncbi:hypothetical protein [Nocardioides sp. R-C-SC26]|uniref:hypothetical protein n=1 Tax=Nocardioides sp. R-C-SC26 TaxID=2870414 RepID=UPI001E287BFC|nr:hypothetical protein [Nocardioides sp. R-C-SC26]